MLVEAQQSVRYQYPCQVWRKSCTTPVLLREATNAEKNCTHNTRIVPSHPILCHELNIFFPQPLTKHHTIGYVMSVIRNCHGGEVRKCGRHIHV